MITNVLGGYMAAVHGPHVVLGAGLAVWSALTLLTPPAALSQQLWLLCAVRALMGLGEGVAFPCVQARATAVGPIGCSLKCSVRLYTQPEAAPPVASVRACMPAAAAADSRCGTSVSLPPSRLLLT
jgi:MFS family permease